MPRPLSPIHRPLDTFVDDPIEPDDDYLARGPASFHRLDNPPPATPPTRISRLAQVDQRVLAGTPRSLGPGGASAVYEQAVRKALVDEMADQLRFGVDMNKRLNSEIAWWAAEIVAAFKE